MLTLLEEKHNEILVLYDKYRDILSELQATLYEKVLPSLVQELRLENDTEDWLKLWLADKGSIFRMFKKHKFDFKSTIESCAYTLRWRIKEREVLQFHRAQVTSHRCRQSLPPIRVRDIYGRPVIMIRPCAIQSNLSEAKNDLICVYETMRQQMAFRYHFQESGSLQFVMIIDCKDVSFSSSIFDVLTWFTREIGPTFPGMCAAAFVINSGKLYGLHSVIKRLLPANARARIYFPDISELNSCFPCPLPFDTEGNFDDSLLDVANKDAEQPPVVEGRFSKITSASSSSSNSSGNLSQLLPSMSVFNPYFGYPVIIIPGSSVPLLRNGRRRRRDLACTLVRLWWMKLKKLADQRWLWILMTIALWGLELMESRKLNLSHVF